MRQVPSWEKYFMDLAVAVAARSKDSHTQVGCVIVDKDKHIIGTGYNGMPTGMVETPELWVRPTKYAFVQHAETNAIKHCTVNPAGATCYVTLYPCIDCATKLVDAKIAAIYYLDDKYKTEETATLLASLGIKTFKV